MIMKEEKREEKGDGDDEGSQPAIRQRIYVSMIFNFHSTFDVLFIVRIFILHLDSRKCKIESYSFDLSEVFNLYEKI